MDEHKSIGALDALLFAINLEVMLLQIRIIGYNAILCLLETLPETSAERRFPESGFVTKRKNQLRDKLTKDRRILKEVIMRTIIELTEDGQWYTLKQAVGILEKNAAAVISLKAQNQKLNLSLKVITTDLERKRQQQANDLRGRDSKVALLRDIIKDTALNARIQFNYAESWLSSRVESLDLQLQTEPEAASPKPEHETIVHQELLRAYALQIKEREELLENWKTRYEQDTIRIDTQLREQCEKLRVTSIRRAEMEKLYKLHEGEMRGWLTFKRERAARLAREERLRKAATRVQAWWRGVLVRRAIGRFRYLRNQKKTTTKSKKK